MCEMCTVNRILILKHKCYHQYSEISQSALYASLSNRHTMLSAGDGCMQPNQLFYMWSCAFDLHFEAVAARWLSDGLWKGTSGWAARIMDTDVSSKSNSLRLVRARKQQGQRCFVLLEEKVVAVSAAKHTAPGGERTHTAFIWNQEKRWYFPVHIWLQYKL